MEAKKIIQLDLPDEIEIGLVDKTKYSTIESQVAFYNLLIKEGEKYYKRENLWDDKMNRDLIGLLKGEVHSLKEDLERERMNNKPLGFMFSNLVIEIELDMFDTIEEQIEYLKRKIRDFDIATINVVTDEYDDIKNKLKQNILSRYSLLKNKNCDWDDFIFDGLWSEIVDSHFDPYRINNAIDRVGKNKTAKFREFIKENFKRSTIDEWIKDYDTKDKLSKIDGFKKNDSLSELERHLKIVNVWNDKFLDGELGKETLGRLKLFEEKFVKDISSEMTVEQEKVKAAIGVTNNRINEQDEINDNLKTLGHKRKNNVGNRIKKEIEDIGDGSLDLKEKIIKLEKLYIEQRTKRWELSELFHKDLKNSVIETELRQTDENMNDCQKKIKTLIITNFENDKKQIYGSVKTDSKIDTHNFEYKLILAHMNNLGENDRLNYMINVKNEIEKIKKIEDMYRESYFMSAQEIMEQIPDINIDYIKFELYYDIIVGFILDFKNGEIKIAESIPTEIEEEFYNRVNKVYELIKIEIEHLEKILGIKRTTTGLNQSKITKDKLDDNFNGITEEIDIINEGDSVIDQDSLIEKFKKECEINNLKKGKTIPNDILYKISQKIGFNVPEIESFKAGEKCYQEAREYASRLGYKRKRKMEPPTS